MNQGEIEIKFKAHWYWWDGQLVIECETLAARDFMARYLEDNYIIVTVKKS